MTPTPAGAKFTFGARVNFDDVRDALADNDPLNTSAHTLRAILGRGSLSTIQKHLFTLRAEKYPVVQSPLRAAPAAPAVPAAPAEVIATLWSVAWSNAQLMTHGALAEVTAQRDAARERALILETDLAAANNQLEALKAALAQGGPPGRKNAQASLI